ncbi:sarcoplasmic calcium-binding protein-like [Liolophura sinensis]|uniref:sarcoplasmic calcium-binding protein-like n=1 Tax=Liolophura sinensis TaxID=3198878 RepID=UPI0031595529
MEFNSFMVKKYRSYFGFLDVYHEGFITKATFDQICENLCRVYSASPEKVRLLKAEVPKWWVHFQDLAENGKVSEQRYIDVIQSCFFLPTTLKTYRDNMARAFGIIFDIIDVDGDNYISIQELRKYYSAFGCTDQKFLRKVFEALDINRNGLISKENYMDVNDKYFFSRDSNSGCAFLFDWSRSGD